MHNIHRARIVKIDAKGSVLQIPTTGFQIINFAYRAEVIQN